MEKIKIKDFKNDEQFEEVKNLNTFKNRLNYYWKYFLNNNLIIFVFSIILLIFAMINAINKAQETNFFIIAFSSLVGLFIYYNSFYYIAALFRWGDKRKFKRRYIFNIGFNKYINKLEVEENLIKNKFLKSNYNLLFFKKENNEFKVKHLIDFIKNDQYEIKNGCIIIDSGYQLVNDENLKEYGLNEDEIKIFEENINYYYLSSDKIESYIEQIEIEKESKNSTERLERFNSLEQFRKNLKIKKEE